MKAKIGILALAVLLVLGVVSVGFAAVEGEGPAAGFQQACQELFASLSPEQQEQFEAARAEFAAQKTELKQSFLDELPDEVREVVEAKMEAKATRRAARMNGNGCGGNCSIAGE